MTNIFVGNLDITATAQQLFAAHGAVEAITIVEDRDTGGDAVLLSSRPKLQRDPARDSSTRDHQRHRM